EVGNCARYQATIVSPGEGEVGRQPFPLLNLVLDLCRLLERLIMIDTENTSRQIGIEEQAAALGREVSSSRMSCDHEGGQDFVICQVDDSTDSIKLRCLPGYWEGNRSVEEHVEVVGIVCALVEVIAVNQKVTAQRLLETEIKLVPL